MRSFDPQMAPPESVIEPSPVLPDAGRGEPTVAQPVRPGERIASVDVLRGFALLGILAMNIVGFGWPMGGYENPHFSGGADGLNTVAWWVNSLFFSGKMMTLFSMLFGAGLVLMADRAAARGASILGVYYRRVFWLLVIGLVHAYLIWSGDILVMYALCGFLLYPFRRCRPVTLLVMSVIVLLISTAAGLSITYLGRYAASVAQQVEADLAAGKKPDAQQVAFREAWNEGMRSFLQPTQRDIDHEIALYRSGYGAIVRGRAPGVVMMQTFGFLLFLLWSAGGRMLLGMALMKWHVFSAARSWLFYGLLALFGYGIGFTLTAMGTTTIFASDFDALRAPRGGLLHGLGMIPVALGHAAVVMMVCKAGLVHWLTTRLATVGRTALSNYLLQSLVCTTLFYGYGLGVFGRLDRVGLWGVVLVIWAVQLAISPIWLRYYSFGPAEWLWRSLTYWRWQPLGARAMV